MAGSMIEERIGKRRSEGEEEEKRKGKGKGGKEVLKDLASPLLFPIS